MKICRHKIDLVLAKKAITVSQLASEYGVSRSRMNVILNSQNITPLCAGRLAKALGVDVAELLEKEKE